MSMLFAVLAYQLKPKYDAYRHHRANQRLLLAAAQGDMEELRRAMAAGADIDYGSKYQLPTAIDIATESGHEDVVKQLLRAGASGRRLDLAVKHGNPEIAFMLLKAGAPPHPALRIALYEGDLPMIKMLLEAGARVDSEGPGSSLLALLHADISESDRLKIARILLERGAAVRDPEAKPLQYGLTPNCAIQLATWRTDLSLGELFAEFGVTFQPQEAVALNRLDEVRRMLEEDPTLLTKKYYDNRLDGSPSDIWDIGLLGMALRRGLREMSMFLLDAGAPVDALTREPMETTLHLAVRGGDPVLVQTLIARGLDVNAVNARRSEEYEQWPHMKKDRGWTPLHYAARTDRVEAAQVLLEAGAVPSIRCDQGRTPLALAAVYGSSGVTELLLQYDHDKESRAEAVRLAREHQRPKVAALLGAASQKQAPAKTPR